MRLTFLFLFVSFSISAQIQGVVKDEEGKPIPYVNIWVENENLGTTSNEDGIFYLNTSEDKVLVFSAVGFESKKTKLLESKTITLKKIIFELEEVVVAKPKKTKTLEIGGVRKEYDSQLSGTNPWIYAKLFKYEEKYTETPFLKEIIFYTNSKIKAAKLKIRLFDFSEGVPTEDLIEEEIIVTVKKGLRKNKLDISKYNLKIPNTGVVVGLEWMIIDENKYEFSYVEGPMKKKIVELQYSPNVVVNYVDEEVGFNYSRGKWYQYRKVATEEKRAWSNKAFSPAIGLILTN